MGILDSITGNALTKANRQNAALIAQGLNAGSDALGVGANNAITSLGTRNAGDAMSSLNAGYGQARNDVTAGYDAAAPALGRLGSAYEPMVAGGQRAFNSFLDASGANGAEGNARATENFRAAPGYAFQRDEALDAVMRSAAARGGLAGGNATADILRTATGLADQSWNGYLGNLNTGAGYYSQGLAGQAQGLGAQANAAIGRGTQLGALGQALGAAQGSLFGKSADIQTGLGRDVAGLWGNATGQLTANNTSTAKAQTEASSNLLGGLLGLGKTAAGAFGSGGGLLNVFGGTGGLFGGGGFGGG